MYETNILCNTVVTLALEIIITSHCVSLVAKGEIMSLSI